MNEAEKLKKRMAHIFLKKGGEGKYTKLFENISLYNKELLLNDVSLRENELPVILGFEIPAEWILLTTERIVWRYKGQISSFENAQIETVEVDFNKIKRRGISLSEFEELEVLIRSGEKIIIHTETGFPFSGIWNVLLHLAWKNQKSPGVFEKSR